MSRNGGILRAADLFCGAGGTSTGAEMTGRVKVVLAVNCWPTAIASHQRNHPHAMHVCKRIEHVDPRNDKSLPEFDLLMASPECTHYANARGGAPIDDQRRSTPFDVLNWVSCRYPRWLLLENVREFRTWGPLRQKRNAKGRLMWQKDGKPWMEADPKRKGEIFNAWLRMLQSFGYQVDCQLLNAADFGAATKRVRAFVIARRGKSKKDIPWPEITHHEQQWRPAWSVIDWSKPCPSIFTRKKPLAEKTLRRIEIGLKKFVGKAAEPFIVHFRNHCDGKSIYEPLNTVTTSGAHHGLAVPFWMPRQGFFDCQKDKDCQGIEKPVNTITAAHGPGHLVVPFLTQYHGGEIGADRNYAVDEPVRTLDTQNRYGLVAPFMLAINHGGDDDRSSGVDDPLKTLTTKTGHSLVVPWLTKYYGTGGVQGTEDPLDTITCRDRFGLAMASLVETMKQLRVVDIGFRMLDVDELARAQGFPDGYILEGNKADRVKQIGNSVSPPVARAICQTIAEAI